MAAPTDPSQALLDTVLNLSRFHREHEKFYAQAPLEQAIALQRRSRVLKTLAERWQRAEPAETPAGNPYAGCEDLNDTAAIEAGGVLFMEGEGEPAEIERMKRELEAAADDFAATGEWLAAAMESSWASAEMLLSRPGLADLLGERHRIIANDWRAAGLDALVARLLRRALELLARVEFSPAALRADLAGPRAAPSYLYSASELLDRAADLVAESAMLVHDNERRWRVFRARVEEVAAGARG